MNIGIVGSRSFENYERLKEYLDGIREQSNITGIISGGAAGADSLGARYAQENDLTLTVYRPKWEKYGKKAGYLRNALIVKESDLVLAFWDGESRGTKHTIDICQREGVPYRIIQV